jgi:hypothetical protein
VLKKIMTGTNEWDERPGMGGSGEKEKRLSEGRQLLSNFLILQVLYLWHE